MAEPCQGKWPSRKPDVHLDLFRAVEKGGGTACASTARSGVAESTHQIDVKLRRRAASRSQYGAAAADLDVVGMRAQT